MLAVHILISLKYRTYAVGALVGGLEGECPPRDLFFACSGRLYRPEQAKNEDLRGRQAAARTPTA
jgi:hypothetical protein